jgi:hypothetical protein
MTVAVKAAKTLGRPRFASEPMVTCNFKLNVSDIELLITLAEKGDSTRSAILREAIRAYAATHLES